MSWVTGLVGKAEDLLNKMDQSAAEALHKDGETQKLKMAPVIPDSGHKARPPKTQNNRTYNDKTSTRSTEQKPDRPDRLNVKSTGGSLSSSASVPSNLNKLNQDGYLSQLSRSNVSGSKSASPSRQNSRKSTKNDKDDELFEFLNSVQTPSPGPSSATTTPETKRKQEKTVKTPTTNGRHSRTSSGSSTVSNKSNNKTQEVTVNDKTGNDETDSLEQSSNENNHEDVVANNDSSGYHSNQEENTSISQQQLSSLELENKLLKSEVAALNQEMASVLKRSKEAQHDLERAKRKMDTHNHQVAQMEQIIRELQSRETDLNEALSAKDSQLGVLRIRYEEAQKEVEGKNRVIHKLNEDKDRILKDHSQSSGVHGQALESLKEKLTEAEMALRRAEDAQRHTQEESLERQSQIESEKRSLAESLTTAQRKLTEEKGKHTDLHVQLKTAKANADTARQELSEYKNKAARILQSKDKLISSLKEGSMVLSGEMGVSGVEFDSLKQERDMLKEELQQARMTLDAMRTELQELETQMQADSDAAQEQISSLEDNLQMERRRREDVEQENNKQKMEIRYTHEEALRQKTAFMQQLQDRESDIEKLRYQLSNRHMNMNSQSELENRLHALTESLIQKQTMLEALSTEKNSLVLQLERLEVRGHTTLIVKQQYRDVQSSVIKVNTSSITMHDDDDEVRHRLPMFMREMPHDGDVTRNVKRAVTSIDKFSIRLGVFLRRYPAARVFIIVYMFVLHLWVMVVLLTYQPEMHHGKDFLPHDKNPEQ